MTHSIFSVLLLLIFFNGCASSQQRQVKRSREHAFIAYWPPPAGSTGLRLAVKDNIDMKGRVTSAGSEYLAKNSAPAARDAPCLALARERNVRVVGKTNLTEFAVTVSGENRFFGSPRSRLDGKNEVIPGGSSSGSAMAVATNMADVAFGTDTGGSIRVPAACCGVYGLKTTYGLVPIKGVFPISPKHLDTVGPLARSIHHLVQGMDLLERDFAARYEQAVADKPSARHITIGRLYLNGTDPEIDKAIDAALAARGFKVIKLNKSFQAKWKQAEEDGKVVALADAWLNDAQYSDKKGVSLLTKLVIMSGELEYKGEYKAAIKRKAAWQRDLRQIFKQVDFIAVPTLQGLPPKMPFWGSDAVFEWRVFDMQNTVGVNFAGNPALAMPIAMPPKGKTVPMTSLQLVGPRLSEAELLNAGRLIETKL
ncbi:amidase [Prosthecobacter sp.]|uniref:amidase n=1 Tax=Prosthecobacter sp. TaxID=1965333 RepID=UPI002AC98726|nr:amidase [Prosthecobacter sp.]